MTIGILALQGAFAEHEAMLEALAADYREIRQRKDLTDDLAGIILPGGETQRACAGRIKEAGCWPAFFRGNRQEMI